MQTIQLQKVNFMTATIYDRYDLRDKIKLGDRFIIRQGDLIISNYGIENYRMRGLQHARIDYVKENGQYIAVFRGTHRLIATDEFLAVWHPEHGLVILPRPKEGLSFYTFRGAVD